MPNPAQSPPEKNRPRPLLILECGGITFAKDNRHHGFGPMFLEAAPYSPDEAIVVDAVNAPLAIDLHGLRYQGVIVSGSLSMVTDPEPWATKVMAFMKTAFDMGMPILGVCYGHQLLAEILGGSVHYHPKGMELGSHEIVLAPKAKSHPLLADLPPAFPAYESHSQAVARPPAGFEVLAASKHDPHQIMAHGDNVLTCQFHPEFSTPFMDDLLEDRKAYVAPPGLPPGIALGTEPIGDNPSRALLRRFLQHARKFTPALPRYRLAP
ncbi:MAG: glutamine amidotransferase, partial [Deltaproteobacteria bacterium]|nr:glutamine amidotransferase [Deltaproteobacteria bacterium]